MLVPFWFNVARIVIPFCFMLVLFCFNLVGFVFNLIQFGSILLNFTIFSRMFTQFYSEFQISSKNDEKPVNWKCSKPLAWRKLHWSPHNLRFVSALLAEFPSCPNCLPVSGNLHAGGLPSFMQGFYCMFNLLVVQRFYSKSEFEVHVIEISRKNE